MGFKEIENQEFKREKKWIDTLNQQLKNQEYENAGPAAYVNKLGLGYLDLNSRMLQMEEKECKDLRQWEQRKNEHKARKKAIEDYWHDSTGQAMLALGMKIPKDGKGKNISRRDPRHYENFSLAELEIVIKNNKYGRNSGVYNDVASDLELFNSLCKVGEECDKFEVLGRLLESCEKYINSRDPITREGKRRMAMIRQIYHKAQQEQESFVRESKEAYAVIDKAEDVTQIPGKVVEKATVGKYNLLSRCLKNEIKDIDLNRLGDMHFIQTEEEAKEDQEMLKIAEALAVQKIGEEQSNILTTRFLNAIGWTKRVPEKTDDFSETVKQSPVQVKLYHTIGIAEKKEVKSKEDPETAKDMIDYLIGKKENSRHYLCTGNYGKGTYTAAMGCNHLNADERMKFQLDQEAMEHSWLYGQREGSMQVVMTFNQNAKIIELQQANALVDHFKTKYPKFYKYVDRVEQDESHRAPSISPAASIILAFYGYNTIRIPNVKQSLNIPSGKNDGKNACLDYYLTFDRSAFSINILNGVFIRTDKGISY